ncbi:hypothetical protein [Streptomyces coelicoflavus]|uniref:hypothetical protein n=1 Tax=Streptomyces coelicoflavus TaxID=285562 RepID=UPI00362822D7
MKNIATELSPLGVGAGVIANLGACVVEIKRFRALLTAQESIATQLIRARQATIVQIFETEKRHAMQVTVEHRALASGYHAMIKMATNMRVSKEERLAATHVVPMLSGQIVQLQITRGDQLIRLSETLQLGDTEAAVSSWRQFQP